MNLNNTNSWSVSIASDDILNFIIYIGCIYGLIDNKRYSGKENLWPSKSLNTVATSERWEEWFNGIVRLKVERIKVGKNPNMVFEEYLPPEFPDVKCPLLKECCTEAWPKFQEWWYMMAGGKAALSFFERIVSNNIIDINEFEVTIGRRCKPFNLYIDLAYTGISENIDININNKNLIITSDPINTLDKGWWIKKLGEIG